MSWVEVFAVLLVSHLVGDFLLQTNWQATHKHAGVGRDGVARRALVAHVSGYAATFVPALVWIGKSQGSARAVAVAAIVLLSHLLLDDVRLVGAYIERVKRSEVAPGSLVFVAVDQTFHVVVLFGAALLAAA